MYVKLFNMVISSSLTQNQPIEVRGVFFMLLAMADQSGVVLGSDEAIARLMNVPMSQFSPALEALMEPEETSKSPDEDGRRVIRLERNIGLKVVNYEVYSRIHNESERRAYFAQKQRESRQRRKNGASAVSTAVAQQQISDGLSSTPIQTFPTPAPVSIIGNRPLSVDAVIAAGQSIGVSELDCRAFWNHYEASSKEDANGNTVWVMGERGEKVVGKWMSLLKRWAENKRAKEEEKKEKQQHQPVNDRNIQEPMRLPKIITP